MIPKVSDTATSANMNETSIGMTAVNMHCLACNYLLQPKNENFKNYNKQIISGMKTLETVKVFIL